VALFEELRTLSIYEDVGDREATRANLSRLGLSVEFYAAYWIAAGAVVAVPSFALAALILWRKSEQLMALFVALVIALLGASFSGSPEALDALNPVLGRAGTFLEELGYIGASLFFFLFPNGRFVPRWTRYLAVVLVVVTVPSALLPNSPFGSNNWSALFYLLFTSGWLLLGVFAQVYRYRRVSGPTERQQTKWVVFGLAAALAILLVVTLLFTYFPAVEPGSILEFIAIPLVYCSMLFVPLSIGIAILNYRLWDIDVIINRALVYGSLTTVLAAVFAITETLLLPLLVQSMLGQEESKLTLVISAVIIATLFKPLRSRIEAGVNRISDRLAGGNGRSEAPQ
jgi:peptidoglycan/LPS O-acetylase OafA/YrhL